MNVWANQMLRCFRDQNGSASIELLDNEKITVTKIHSTKGLSITDQAPLEIK